MGNYRFRLSDMIPNSWFYKLKDMGLRRRHHRKEPSSSASHTKQQQILLHSHPRKSHRFGREFGNSPADIMNLPAEPPRKSSRGKPRRRPTTARTSPRLVVTSSSGCSCGTTNTDGPPLQLPSPPSHLPELGSDPAALLSQYSFDGVACGCHDCNNPDADANANAIIIEKEQKTSAKNSNHSPDELKSLAQIELSPIITRSSSKPEEADAADGSLCPSLTVSVTKKDKSFAREPRNSPSRRFPVNSPGPKFRMNSPRVSSKRFGQVSRRKSVSSSSKRSLIDSLAIVKSTNDPQRDFRESMVEMIVENKISASNELEDLLACYLSLNTDEYHDIIIKVYKQIWFDMTDNIGLD